MRWKWLLLGMVGFAGCIDFGGKLDTPIEGGNGGALGGGGSLVPQTDGGSEGGVVGTFSCDHKNVDSTCTTYGSGTTQADAQASCDGTLRQTTCPTAGAVGTCRVGPETDVYYSDGALPRTADDAKTACDFSGGIFSR